MTLLLTLYGNVMANAIGLLSQEGDKRLTILWDTFFSSLCPLLIVWLCRQLSLEGRWDLIAGHFLCVPLNGTL